MSTIKNVHLPAVLASQPLLGPLVALNIWTFTMEGWMYATRLPAMQQNKVEMKPTLRPADLDEQLPPHVQWKAHNYNHLMEQPTQFYAIALALTFLGIRDKTSVSLAWAYVGLRVAHSLVQATVNKIEVRFPIFLASSAALLGMTVRAATQVFSTS